ncbi:MAG: hypothetical protein KF713_19180 [Turneriella sp.]|nr:hypothetical protein [Turneriella sp.]
MNKFRLTAVAAILLISAQPAVFSETPLTSDKVFIGKPEATGNEVPEAENQKLRSAKIAARRSAELSSRLTEDNPGARLVTRADGVYCSNGLASLVFEGDDDHSGLVQIRYRLNDGDWNDYRGPVRVREEGRHWLKWESVDRVGNREKQQGIRLFVDKTAPLVTIAPQGEFVVLKNQIFARPGFKMFITAKDETCGVQGVYVDSGSGWRKSENQALEFNQAGRFTVRVMADDIIDNRSEIRSVQLTIDGDEPTVQLRPSKPLYKEGNEVVCRPETEILVAASDASSEVSRIEIRRSPSAGWLVLHHDKIEVSQSGEFYLEVRAVDIAGNTTKSPEIFRCKSPAPPPKSILTPKDGQK